MKALGMCEILISTRLEERKPPPHKMSILPAEISTNFWSISLPSSTLDFPPEVKTVENHN